MTYELEGNNLLLQINRADIVDISVDDTITVKGFGGLVYKWTEHDREFVENNPDDDIFLEIESADNRKFRAVGIVLK
jgi:hypothetical protein